MSFNQIIFIPGWFFSVFYPFIFASISVIRSDFQFVPLINIHFACACIMWIEFINICRGSNFCNCIIRIIILKLVSSSGCVYHFCQSATIIFKKSSSAKRVGNRTYFTISSIHSSCSTSGINNIFELSIRITVKPQLMFLRISKRNKTAMLPVIFFPIIFVVNKINRRNIICNIKSYRAIISVNKSFFISIIPIINRAATPP